MNWVKCSRTCLSRDLVKAERRDIGLKLSGSERSLVWGDGINNLGCLQRWGEAISFNA